MFEPIEENPPVQGEVRISYPMVDGFPSIKMEQFDGKRWINLDESLNDDLSNPTMKDEL